MFSRMRSEITTLSFTEKPTMVSRAATVVRSNSMFASESAASAKSTLCSRATATPTPKRRSNRIAM